jgi:DNA-directed RNA polymerase subunit K/omega
MEIKKGKLKVREIQSLNQALNEIANMLVDPEIMMDLGIIKADHKVF